MPDQEIEAALLYVARTGLRDLTLRATAEGHEVITVSCDLVTVLLDALDQQDGVPSPISVLEHEQTHGVLTARLQSELFPLLAEATASWFAGNGAVNYCELRMSSEATGPLLLTVQRIEGKTPHELRVKAEQEREQLRNQALRAIEAQHRAEQRMNGMINKIDKLQARIDELEVQKESR